MQYTYNKIEKPVLTISRTGNRTQALRLSSQNLFQFIQEIKNEEGRKWIESNSENERS
jgi:hypothetical protein